jgi:hypothetical protein
MEIKITLSGFSRFIVKLPTFNKKENLFVQLIGSFKSLWNELEMYHPHTTDVAILRKGTEEDIIFQLLASLSLDFDDMRSHILMNPKLSSLKLVCATIQREEIRRKVMTHEVGVSNTHAY